MTLEPDERDELEEILEAAVGSKALTEWERSFVDDLYRRFEEYGDETRVSTRQWGVLRRIWGKL